MHIHSQQSDATSRDVPATTCDVLVVGAGPAGLTTAISLARHGIDVLVVERHTGTSPFPKATGVSARTMELFRTWGIEQRIRAGAMQVQPVMTVSDTLITRVKFTVPFGYPTDAAALAVSPCTPCCCPQDLLEPVLLDHLLESGGRIRFGVEVTDLTNGSTGVRATLRDHDRAERVSAKYLVGADGPRSTVRSAVGIGIDDLGSIGDFVAVTFRAAMSARLGRPPAAINNVEISGAEGVFVPTDGTDRWIYAREWHPDHRAQQRGDTLADWTDEYCTDLIRAGSGIADLEPEISSVLPFVMGGHVANTFSSGRVFLVGDAAHRTTPVGGTGMNTAIHAAHNLGWKLAWVLRGWAHPDLLDSYESERRPIGTANVLRSLRRGPGPGGPTGGPGVGGPGAGGAGVGGPGADADGLAGDLGVRYRSAVIDSAVIDSAVIDSTVIDSNAAVDLTGPDFGETSDAIDDLEPGRRAPHAWLRRNGDRLSTIELFDGQLTLITGVQGGDWHRAAAELSADGLPIVSMSLGRDVQLEQADRNRAYQLADDEAVLVRPDGYVAWRSPRSGAATGDLHAAVAMTLGRCADVRATLRRAG